MSFCIEYGHLALITTWERHMQHLSFLIPLLMCQRSELWDGYGLGIASGNRNLKQIPNVLSWIHVGSRAGQSFLTVTAICWDGDVSPFQMGSIIYHYWNQSISMSTNMSLMIIKSHPFSSDPWAPFVKSAKNQDFSRNKTKVSLLQCLSNVFTSLDHEPSSYIHERVRPSKVFNLLVSFHTNQQHGAKYSLSW